MLLPRAGVDLEDPRVGVDGQPRSRRSTPAPSPRAPAGKGGWRSCRRGRRSPRPSRRPVRPCGTRRGRRGTGAPARAASSSRTTRAPVPTAAGRPAGPPGRARPGRPGPRRPPFRAAGSPRRSRRCPACGNGRRSTPRPCAGRSRPTLSAVPWTGYPSGCPPQYDRLKKSFRNSSGVSSTMRISCRMTPFSRESSASSKTEFR